MLSSVPVAILTVSVAMSALAPAAAGSPATDAAAVTATAQDVVSQAARTPTPKVTVAQCTPRKRPARGFPAPTSAETAVAGVKQTRMMDGWAYFGPRAGLSRGKFTVKDRTGCVVARGVTTPTGAFGVPFRKGALPRLPLTVTVVGGKAAGKPFKGRMKARVFALKKHTPTTQISLASTAASRLATQEKGYAKATKKVMRSLGFSKTALSWSMQFRNSHVGYRQLVKQIRSTKGGFDGFTAKLARKAKANKPMRGLRPTSAMTSGPRQVQGQTVSAAEAADSSVCDVPVPSSGSSSSDEVISNVAAIGIGGLLEYAGTPATSADGITGMLLSPLGSDSETTVLQADVNAVLTELTCISEQLTYLSDQLAYMQYTIDISGSEQCASDVNTYYYDYQQLLSKASQYPINSSNTSLMDDLPQWDGLNTSCAQDVNNSLFGTAGGQPSAWQQLNQNYESGVEWYTQWQVQALQSNLQYWGTILYNAFILENEYYNFYGEWENADIIAGGSNPDGDSPVCDSGSMPTTPNYCVYQSNITAAFPADLYSDEIGIISSGAGINALPGGMIAPPPIWNTDGSAATMIPDTNANANQSFTPTAMTGPWWYNQYLNMVEYSPNNYSGSPPVTMYATGTDACGSDGDTSGCLPSSSWDWAYEASRYFNLELNDPDGAEYQINPNGYGSAVQTFWNPQNTGRASVTWSSVSELAQEGPSNNGSSNSKMTAEQVFYDAINQTPSPYPSSYQSGGAWSQFSESSATYWTDDTSSWIKVQVEAIPAAGTWEVQSWIGAPLGNTSGWSVKNSQNNIPNTPIFAYLSGRTWWTGAAQASSFKPPNPPTS